MSNDEITDQHAERMLKAIFNQKPNNKTAAVILHDCEEKDFPASMPVLRLAIVDDQIHMTIAKEEDKNGSYVYNTIQSMAFDLPTFLKALDTLLED
jgi:hypothetical protein